MGHIERSAAARADLISHFVYMAQEASEAIAVRFLDRAQEFWPALHPDRRRRAHHPSSAHGTGLVPPT